MEQPESVLGVTEAKDRFNALVRQVQAEAKPVFIGSHRKPQAVLVSMDQWNALALITDALTAQADPEGTPMDSQELRKKVAKVTAGHRMAGLPISDQNIADVEAILTGKTTAEEAIAASKAKYQALQRERNRAAS